MVDSCLTAINHMNKSGNCKLGCESKGPAIDLKVLLELLIVKLKVLIQPEHVEHVNVKC